MYFWLQKRRWRRTVEEGFSRPLMEAEREAVSAELAGRVTQLLGGRGSSEPARDTAATAIDAAVARSLDHHLVRASLGLKYLALMKDRVRWADYEDVRRLSAEVKWLEGYLAARLRSPWVAIAQGSSSMAGLPPVEVVYASLAARIAANLDSAAIAA